MDQQTLAKLILREAYREYWNGKGRLFVNQFLQAHQINEESFLDAVQQIQRQGITVKQSTFNDNIYIFRLPRK